MGAYIEYHTIRNWYVLQAFHCLAWDNCMLKNLPLRQLQSVHATCSLWIFLYPWTEDTRK